STFFKACTLPPDEPKTVSIATLHQLTSAYLRPPSPPGRRCRAAADEGGQRLGQSHPSPGHRPPSPSGRGNAQRRIRGSGLRLPSPAGRRCRAAADEGVSASASPTPHPAIGHSLPVGEGTRSGGSGGQGFGYLHPPGEGAAQRRMRGSAPRPAPPLTRPSATLSQWERERAAADQGVRASATFTRREKVPRSGG